MRAPLALCGLLVALAAEAGAQDGVTLPAGRLIVCDSTDDRVLALADRDASGAVEPTAAGEIVVFYDDSSPGPDLSVPSHVLAGDDGEIYLLDGGTLDAILRLEDLNGDGDANDGGEATVFYDASTGGPALFTPNTLVLEAGGSMLVADDGSSGRRILRLGDTNTDRDALDEGEATIVYDGTALSLPVLEDIESLAVGPAGELYVGETTLAAVYRLIDRNRDGDYLDEEEVGLFFQGAGDAVLEDIDALAFTGGAVLVADENRGIILRLADLDGDGQAAGLAEVGVFLGPDAGTRVEDINDFLVLPATGQLLVLDGAADTVLVVADLDGDLAASGPGEVVRWLLDGGESFATPHGLAFLAGEDDPPPPPSKFRRGEVTGDGQIDLSDAVAILNVLFTGGADPTCEDALDVNDSGDVNISDPVSLLNFLFLGGPPPPRPFQEVGEDPTPDTLDC